MDTYEYFMMIKELGRLFEDYENCKDPYLRNEIYSDIELLSEVIAS